MKTFSIFFHYVFISVLSLSLHGQSQSGWKSTTLHNDFYAEGAGFGDIDGDGKGDLVSGPFWYKGPAFEEKHEYYEPKLFDIRSYSDNFFAYIHDINSDGLNDILIYGFPAKEARLYINPGRAASANRWPMKILADDISTESPHWIDLIPGGLPEMVCGQGSAFGYYEAGDDPTEPWIWTAVSDEGETRKFDHGLGVGDLDGDGRLDVISKSFWWKQPSGESKKANSRRSINRRRPAQFVKTDDTDWTKHTWNEEIYPGGAQIILYDVDADGDNDIITSLHAHGFGLAWHEQTSPGDFAEHRIMNSSSTDNPYGVSFSQLHALELSDIDGDGIKDIVTGKRWYAHHGKDPGGLQDPVLYWFRLVRGLDSVDFIPHLVHDDSGVGVEVLVDDLNSDGRPDIVSANKHGLAVHIQDPGTSMVAVERWKVHGGRSQDNYQLDLKPEESLKLIDVPEGFDVDLITAEPDLVQPIAMCFDAKGRIWVIEGTTYPRRALEGEGTDRILIFEDKDADGSFESRKVFVDGINLASGLEIGFGGVFVGAAPNLLFFPDADGDDVPDREPTILLDGWGFHDTHETLNSFTWGPDGWLYGTHGVFTYSKVGKPGTPDDERQDFNAGVWRYHPTKDEFEVFAFGTSNPWGVDFNDKGDFFISACVIPHFYNMIQGGRYIRQGSASHFNPYIFESIDTIADHAHYTGRIQEHAFWQENKALRPAAPADTSALGGGHAHAGLALYLADTFPENYRGEAFFHNLHGHRIIREALNPNGSGYTAQHKPGFMFTNDHDFIGVGVMLGPDGALYFSDWHDAQTCHHRDVEMWDKTNGRIFRVRYGDVNKVSIDLTQESDAALTDYLANSNAFYARQAQRILQERAHSGSLDKSTIKLSLETLASENEPQTIRLRAIWTQWVCGLLDEADLLTQLKDNDPYIRAWSLQFLGESKSPLSKMALSVVESLAKNESSLVTLRYVASLMQRIPLEQRWGIAEALLKQPDGYSHDINLPYLLWYGMEPLVGEDPVRAMAMAEGTKWEKLKSFIFRRAAVKEAGRALLVASLSKAPNAVTYKSRADQLLLALEELPPVEKPAGWDQARNHGESLAKKANQLDEGILQLSTRFGDSDTFPKWREIVQNKKARFENRVEAMEILLAGGDEQLGAISRLLVKERQMREAALVTLAYFPGPETAQVLISTINNLPPFMRNQVVNTLTSTPDMTVALLKAVDTGELDTSLISPVLLDQIGRYDNEDIQSLIAANWTRTSVKDVEDLEAAIKEWKDVKLTAGIRSDGDASRGRAVFRNTCGTCHSMFGDGVDIGPNLTGSNRADLDYVLENVLAPNAIVSKDYLVNIFNLKDGRVISGMIQKESPEAIAVAMPGGTTMEFSPSQVMDRTQLNQSLMPAGLFNALTIEQVSDLIAYLASPEQVRLPSGEL
ncbi:MAG: c-type cytochrome [Verrucomicrobia bacterium]|nr:c-type cytochrome [Verrucomicrobiota bacterium]